MLKGMNKEYKRRGEKCGEIYRKAPEKAVKCSVFNNRGNLAAA
jgi:hypothetical protein